MLRFLVPHKDQPLAQHRGGEAEHRDSPPRLGRPEVILPAAPMRAVQVQRTRGGFGLFWAAGSAGRWVASARESIWGVTMSLVAGASPVQHFWSLAVEEQFYLVWPALLLVVALVAARGTRVVTVLLCMTWLLSLIWSVLLTPRSPPASYFSSATRAWELATGALLALAGHLLPHIPRLARHVLSALGLVGLVVAALSYDASTPFPGWHALLPVLGAAATELGTPPDRRAPSRRGRARPRWPVHRSAAAGPKLR